jgi:hypothetical protein
MKNKKRKPRGYYNKKRCLKEALKCNTKSELQNKNISVYNIIIKNKWTECFAHMELLGDKYNRLIYVIIFPKKHAYVGLTGNPKRRFKDHLNDKDGILYKHIKNNDINKKDVQFIKLTNFLNKDIASKQEGAFMEKYEKKGYIILNKAKTGGLGGITKKWTKDACLKEAKKYINRVSFQKNNTSAYQSAYRNGCMEEVCAHMISKKKPTKYWTKKNCLKEAINCSSKKEFKTKNPGAYHSSIVNKWLDEICVHMILKNKPRGYWKDFNNIYNAAKKCKNVEELRDKYNGAHKALQLFENIDNKKKIYTELGWKNKKINNC